MVHLALKHFSPFRKSFSPCRRHKRHFASVYLATAQTRLFLGGRQPLCGIGVTSDMLLTLKPATCRARTAESRPGPGPFTRTSIFFMPNSFTFSPARSAATCAAKGVLLRDPL